MRTKLPVDLRVLREAHGNAFGERGILRSPIWVSLTLMLESSLRAAIWSRSW